MYTKQAPEMENRLFWHSCRKYHLAVCIYATWYADPSVVLPIPNSSMLVFPISTAPASRSLATHVASYCDAPPIYTLLCDCKYKYKLCQILLIFVFRKLVALLVSIFRAISITTPCAFQAHNVAHPCSQGSPWVCWGKTISICTGTRVITRAHIEFQTVSNTKHVNCLSPTSYFSWITKSLLIKSMQSSVKGLRLFTVPHQHQYLITRK